MAKIKFNKKERTLIITLIKEKAGALEGKLKHFQFLDQYDKEDFPISLEQELQDEIDELHEIAEKLGEHLKEGE